MEAEEDDKAEAEAEQTAESRSQTIPDIDLTGTWYDPTGYCTAEFTFNGDGTGTINWGNSTDNLTYSLNGNTINVVLPYNTDTRNVKVRHFYYEKEDFYYGKIPKSQPF